MNSEDFAKAVDHAMKELDDIEEAQRRIRTLAEEHFRTDQTEKRRPQLQKDLVSYIQCLILKGAAAPCRRPL